MKNRCNIILNFSFILIRKIRTYFAVWQSALRPMDSGNPRNFHKDKSNRGNRVVANSWSDQCSLDRQDSHPRKTPKWCSVGGNCFLLDSRCAPWDRAASFPASFQYHCKILVSSHKSNKNVIKNVIDFYIKNI